MSRVYLILLIIFIVAACLSSFLKAIPLIKEVRYSNQDYSAYLFPAGQFTLELIQDLPMETEVPSIIVNANYFDQTLQVLGFAKQSSDISNRLHSGGQLLNALMLFNQNDKSLVIDSITNFSSYRLAEYSLGLQAGPLLVKNEKKIWPLDTKIKSERTAICLTLKKELLVMVSIKKMSLGELQELLLAKFACESAINLDGGSSSQLYEYQLTKRTVINSLIRPPLYLKASLN